MHRVRRPSAPEVRPRGGGSRGERSAPVVLVPSKSTEHIHRAADGTDARRGVFSRGRAQRLSARPTAAPARWFAPIASSRKSASEKKPWYIPLKRTWLVATPNDASRAA